jgi:signal transduction histidine kinase/CheY-like chemotaxis protein
MPDIQPHRLLSDANTDIFDAVSDSVVILDKDLRVEWANAATVRDRELPVESLLGRHCYEMWHSRTSPCEICLAAKAMSSGISQQASEKAPNAGDHFRTYVPRTDALGNVVGVVEIRGIGDTRFASMRADIWKSAADKSLAKEELIRLLLSMLGSFFGVSRASYYENDDNVSALVCKVQWCAPGLESYSGDQIPLSIFQNVTSFFHADLGRITRDNLPEPLQDSLGNYLDKHAIQSLLLVLFDRSTYSFFSFADCNGTREWTNRETALILEMMHIVRIRVYQLEMEREKSALEVQLRHAQTLEAIGQLAGGVAHDFNNALGAISGYAEMIRQKFAEGNPKLDKYTAAILSSARRAADLTTQLLAFARKGRFQKTRLDIHETISQVSLLLQHSLDQKTKLALSLDAENPIISADPIQVQNVLLNLALNARDAMPKGGTLSFATENRELDELLRKSHPEAWGGLYVVVHVSDTGVGMDEKTKARLFEPFFTTKDIGSGSGLGLASVYGTVTSHNGFVSVSSQVGKGSTITVFLPVADPAGRKSGNAALAHVVRGTGSIVLIDNDEPIRAICREMLTVMGYTVSEFASGSRAVEHFRTHEISQDLFIIDMIMEDMNGRECFRQLREINPKVKAILSSGYRLEADLPEIAAEGICAVLQKPFDTATLSRIVAQAMNAREGAEPSALQARPS